MKVLNYTQDHVQHYIASVHVLEDFLCKMGVSLNLYALHILSHYSELLH